MLGYVGDADFPLVAPGETALADIPGLCGIVRGSILPGYWGLEAGQSAVGDIYNWFVNVIQPGGSKAGSHEALTKAAAKLRPGESGLLALDWNNGNRTVLVDQRLTGLILGQTLHTTAAEIYRALIEASAFGSRMIIERVAEYGVPINRIICAGGIAEKNPMLMQIYADVTGSEMRVSGSSQACALGAAVGAAVIAGEYPDFHSAQMAMTRVKEVVYRPDPENHKVYNELFSLYRKLHDAFGGVDEAAGLGGVMKDLLAIKARQSTS